ncbi:MAG: right-handed parallel beta-helix repeat-containing protein [Saprospiraceae bacterium]|nr:right-handed parallel beta-helix repeat-containing protein [Saprospiraceae bacterium]
MVFQGCKNIRIEGVRAGHGPEKGGCAGGVFSFEDCQNVTVTNSTLYGSGTEGITASNTQNLRCENSIIEECTYHIATFSNSSNAVFSNCIFRNNEEFSLVNLIGNSALVFEKCQFLNNKAYNSAYPEFSYPLFDHEAGSTIELKACMFENNNVGFFAKRQTGITLKKNRSCRQ